MQIGLNFYDPPILTHCHLVQDVLSVKNIKLSPPTPNVIGTKHLFINLLPLFFFKLTVFFLQNIKKKTVSTSVYKTDYNLYLILLDSHENKQEF